MTYWVLNSAFLGVAAIVAGFAVMAARRGLRGGLRWSSVALAGVVVLVMTGIFDNVMIAVGLVAYAEEKLSGIFVGIAPIEDFSYSVAALALLPALWVLLDGRPKHRRAGHGATVLRRGRPARPGSDGHRDGTEE